MGGILEKLMGALTGSTIVDYVKDEKANYEVELSLHDERRPDVLDR